MTVQSVELDAVLSASAPGGLDNNLHLRAGPHEMAPPLSRIMLAGPNGTVEVNGESGPTGAMLRDPAMGRVRGILLDWPDPATAQADALRAVPELGLDVQVSRGIPTLDAWRR